MTTIVKKINCLKNNEIEYLIEKLSTDIEVYIDLNDEGDLDNDIVIMTVIKNKLSEALNKN